MTDATPTRPDELVVEFLRACEARDLDAAEKYLADGATFTFPGEPPWDDLRACLATQGRKYRGVRKEIDVIDVAPRGDDEVMVYVSGRLFGEANDGSAIADVRFLDRFLLRDSRIVQQEVWNDLAVAAAVGTTRDP